jgi:hypothetical protein
MLDMTALFATWLAADSEVVAAAVPIYSDVIPENPTYPLVLVRDMTMDNAVPGVPLVWERHELQLDIVGSIDGYATTVDAAGLVRRKVDAFQGVVATAVIAGAIVVSTTRLTDDSISPARPRWVLAVEVTARAN